MAMPQKPHILFVCGRNQWRSPTAAETYASDQRIEVRSAGVSPLSAHRVSKQDLEWADLVLVMEPKHEERLVGMFRQGGAPREMERLLVPPAAGDRAHPEMSIMFGTHDNSGYKNPLPGIQQKTLVHGQKTLMVEFQLQKGAVLPMHKHPHEQIGCLVSGRLDMTIGNETRHLGPGDSWCIPGDAVHGATALEDSVAVEVFSPVREDYLPQGGRA